MTYRAGVGPSLQAIGLEPGSPMLICDKCGFRQSVQNKNGDVSQTWLNKRTLKGWSMVRAEVGGDVVRHDVCPACVKRAGKGRK